MTSSRSGSAAGGGDPSSSADPAAEECMVCSDNKRDVLFQPCGHVCACASCADRVKKCLICRREVLSHAEVSDSPRSPCDVTVARGGGSGGFIWWIGRGRVAGVVGVEGGGGVVSGVMIGVGSESYWGVWGWYNASRDILII